MSTLEWKKKSKGKAEKKQCPHCLGFFAPAGYNRWHGDKCIKKPVKEPIVIPWLALITLIIAFIIAGVSAWYSILGLTTIFAGAAIEVAIMATSLEVGKLVTAAWLHLRWNTVPFLLRMYLTIAVLVLMFITSIGVFGFLSKAHLEQTIKMGGTNTIKIESLERRIDNEKRRIEDAETVIAQLDKTIQTLLNYDRVRGEDGAVAVRESQQEERKALNAQIETAFANIESIQVELFPLKQQQLSLEAEVGPLKYIAELIYGSNTTASQLDSAVRGLIILLVFVMDPLAVLLTIAGLMTFHSRKNVKIIEKNIDAMIME